MIVISVLVVFLHFLFHQLCWSFCPLQSWGKHWANFHKVAKMNSLLFSPTLVWWLSLDSVRKWVKSFCFPPSSLLHLPKQLWWTFATKRAEHSKPARLRYRNSSLHPLVSFGSSLVTIPELYYVQFLSPLCITVLELPESQQDILVLDTEPELFLHHSFPFFWNRIKLRILIIIKKELGFANWETTFPLVSTESPELGVFNLYVPTTAV